MNTTKALEAVFDELLISGQEPTAETLEKWLEHYPQYRQDIVEFVSEWRLQDRLPPEGTEFEDSVVANEVLKGLHGELVRRADMQQPFCGIFTEAQRLGLRLEQEASDLGVNVQLLDLLDRKHVRVDTMPERFLVALAARIQVSSARLGQWLSEGTPTLRPAMQLGAHSFTKPRLLSFEIAWKQSGLSAQALEKWGDPAKKRGKD
jgi:hypothetical protein